VNTGTKTISIAEEAFQKNIIYSKWLWRAAWSIEIVAAGIGFATGIVIAVGSRVFIEANTASYPGGVWGNVILAGLPFFAIAIVELMKIPMAMGFYFSRRILWKIVFLIALCALSVLTFETIINGLERNQSQQAAKTQNEINEKDILDKTLKNQIIILDEINALTTENINKTYQETEAAAIKKRDGDLASSNNEISRDENRINTLKEEAIAKRIALLEGTEGREKQKENLIASKKNNQDQADKQIKDLRDLERDEIAQEERSAAAQISSEKDIIAGLREDKKIKQEELANAGIFANKSAIQSEIDAIQKSIEESQQRTRNIQDRSRTKEAEIRASYEQEINTIRSNLNTNNDAIDAQIAAINKQINELVDTSEEALTLTIESYDQQLGNASNKRITRSTQIDKQYDATISQANGRRDLALTEFERRQGRIPGLEFKIEELREDITDVEKKINEATGGFQMRRFASVIYGVPPARVTPDQVGLVTRIWLISVSLIVSLIGTILALASFVLADREVFTPKNITKKPIRSSLRRLILSRRKFYQKNNETRFANFLRASTEFLSAAKERLLRPKIKYFERPVEKIVTVTKEVPVDKVVYKEVPKEIIKKEMVYVPFYSIEGGTVDLTGEIEDLTDPEEIKQKIKQAVDKYQTKKKDTSKK